MREISATTSQATLTNLWVGRGTCDFERLAFVLTILMSQLCSMVRMRVNFLGLIAALLATGVAQAQTPQTVQATRITPSSGIEKQDIRAQVKAIEEATLAAEVSARIKQMPVQEGGRFKKDDVLVLLDCAVQEAQKTKAQAELDGAVHTLRANQQMRELNSVGELEVLISKSERDRAAGELAVIEAQISKCVIRAPFSGVMSERLFEQHEYVQAGEPVVAIFNDSLFEVEFLTPSTWISWIQPGLTFDVRIDELELLLTATVSRVGSRIDPVSQSIKVTGEIVAPTGELKPGMSGQAILQRI